MYRFHMKDARRRSTVLYLAVSYSNILKIYISSNLMQLLVATSGTRWAFAKVEIKDQAAFRSLFHIHRI